MNQTYYIIEANNQGAIAYIGREFSLVPEAEDAHLFTDKEEAQTYLQDVLQGVVLETPTLSHPRIIAVDVLDTEEPVESLVA